jgi:hypothetical protein
LETGSLTVELTPLKPIGDLRFVIGDLKTAVPWVFNYKLPITNYKLFHFFVRRVLAAPAAKFLQLQPVRRRLAVLGGRVVPLLALTALQRNDLSGHENSS